MKLILTALLLTGSLIAKEFTTRYDVNVGMFGKVGYADISLEEDKESYSIKLVANMVGTAATLTNNRVETYISEGKIVDGKYIPTTFYKIRTTNDMSKTIKYSFNHDTKSISMEKESVETVSGTRFDASSFKIVETKELKKSSHSEILESYIDSDILSSYLNTRKSCNAQQKNYDLQAIGARNDRNDITVSFLDEVKKEEVKNSFSADIGNIYNLHVQPMNKEKTTVDILMAFDNDGLMKEAVLGNVFWIGEITAKRVYHDLASK